MILDTIGIQKMLPHRYPFLMVDAVLEMERLKRIVGVKNVSINESHFQGHFPGKPIMPGVLIIEAMAQTGGLLLLLEIPDRANKLLYFAAVDNARFRQARGSGRPIDRRSESAQLARAILQIAGICAREWRNGRARPF